MKYLRHNKTFADNVRTLGPGPLQHLELRLEVIPDSKGLTVSQDWWAGKLVNLTIKPLNILPNWQWIYCFSISCLTAAKNNWNQGNYRKLNATLLPAAKTVICPSKLYMLRELNAWIFSLKIFCDNGLISEMRASLWRGWLAGAGPGRAKLNFNILKMSEAGVSVIIKF